MTVQSTVANNFLKKKDLLDKNNIKFENICIQGLSLEMYFLICLMLGLEISLKAKVGGKIFLIVGHF